MEVLTEIITADELKEAQDLLSPEEIEKVFGIALREAMLAKKAEIKNREYWESINNPKPKPVLKSEDFYKWILKKGEKEIKNFSLSPLEESIYMLLAMYFNNDPRFEEQGRSLSKGLMLYGGVGCGKTTMMKLFRDNPSQKFGVVECMNVADQYKDKEIGYMVINKFSSLSSICFNDLGTEIEEGVSSNFGNKKNVMAEIILTHYEKNDGKIFKMHFTTNNDGGKLLSNYGERVADRFNEMCNVISLVGIKSKRK